MGLIHLYHGDGKGKSTAAFGLALRAIAAGFSVCIVQFLKNKASGEIQLLETMSGVTIFRGKAGNHFTSKMTSEERAETLKISNRNLLHAINLSNTGFCQFLILDEACAAWNENLVDHNMLQKFIENKPEDLELVLTGRNPPECFFNVADYITKMVKEKHPMDLGVMAREGIEF
ncbi:MAG: cob(I)yrinic acid a,c-diamide adenosyltransferase [Treponema sp.]|nr:cob(I)yrinic acid a,c-diamide adenosyltransferase [Treponema sp.]